MSLSKYGDDYNKETLRIGSLISQPFSLLFLQKIAMTDKSLTDEQADSRVAKSGLERVAPNYFD